jgi:hypothetical protein
VSKPGPALSFYLSHSDDVVALVERESPPDGVSEGDWSKFERVVAMANEEVAELLLACRTAITNGLGDTVVPVGNGASRTQVALTWDVWRTFRRPGPGKKPVGYLGACLHFADGEGRLVGYVRPHSAYPDLRDGLKAAAPSLKQLAFFTPDTALVFESRLGTDTDLEQATTACGRSFEGVRQPLARYLSR